MKKKETVKVQCTDEATGTHPHPALDVLLARMSLRCCKSISVAIDRDAADSWTPGIQLCSHLWAAVPQAAVPPSK